MLKKTIEFESNGDTIKISHGDELIFISVGECVGCDGELIAMYPVDFFALVDELKKYCEYAREQIAAGNITGGE
jgi:hypothetical protein